MILNWASEFEPSVVAWYCLASAFMLATLVPGMILIVGCLAAQAVTPTPNVVGRWIGFLCAAAITWFALTYSLAFGPALELNPEVADVTAPLGLQEMLELDAATVDRRHLMGRGGWIGNLDFALFSTLPPQGNSDEPLFSSRRPFHQIPHLAFQTYHLAIFLAATGAMQLLFSNRRSRRVACLCSVIWGIVVYAPGVHWVWGDGWLSLAGAFDFGGALVFLLVGFSMLGVAVGSKNVDRSHTDEFAETPYFNTAMLMGFVLLVTGVLAMNQTIGLPGPGIQATAAFNGLLAICAGCVTWYTLLFLRNTPISNADGVLGTLAGLCAICGGSGMIVPRSAVIVAVVSTAASFGVLQLMTRRSLKGRTFGVIACTGVPAGIGLILSGVFAHENYGVRHWNGNVISGIAEGNAAQLMAQIQMVICIALFAFTVSFAITFLTRRYALRQQ